MNIEETKKFADKAEGWLSDREGEILYNLAKNCKGKGVIVEIGSWEGKSTIWIGSGSKNGNKVKIYAIDPHTGSSEHQKENEKIWTFEEFKKNIKNAKVDDIILPLVKTSEEAAKNFNKPVEFIFIDGAHEYEFVKLDFDLWFPKVVNGGIMAFHDTISWKSPKKVVADYVYKSKHFKNVKFVDTITFAQKVEQNSLKDRLKNRYVLLLKNLYEFAGKLHLPKSNVKTIVYQIYDREDYMKKSLGAKTLIYPTPVWLVGTYDKKGKPNVATIAWGGVCSSKPPCVAISLRGATYTHGNIMERRAFTINVPSAAQVEIADYCGMASGKNVDKFAAAKITAVKSDKVDAPSIQEFPMIIECKLSNSIEIGIHTHFIGEIMDVRVDEAMLGEDGLPDILKINPILYGPGIQSYYGTGKYLGKAFSIGKKIS